MKISNAKFKSDFGSYDITNKYDYDVAQNTQLIQFRIFCGRPSNEP